MLNIRSIMAWPTSNFTRRSSRPLSALLIILPPPTPPPPGILTFLEHQHGTSSYEW